MNASVRTPGSAAALVALSAAGFGALAIFVRAAYDEGADMLGVLLPRFALAALALWLLLRWRHTGLPARARLPALVLMGAAYVAQSFCFFGALLFLPAGMVALLLYLYPLFVVLLSWLLGLESLTRRRLVALAVCSAGTVLTLGWSPGQGGGPALDPRGVALALGAACIYACYIIGGSRATRGVAPLASTAVILTSAAAVLACVASVRALGGLPPQLAQTLPGWGAVAAIVLVSTVLAIGLFVAGLERLGASRTALISMLEPVVTVLLAWVFLQEHLGAAQLAGGALVLGGALLLATERGAPAPAA
ncbi:hypothetical protein B2J86_12760 [Acidovorax sp. SRB_14]|uniref:EamA family transporter n=1 Tax=unclassified Acidovorax TaxID=2684926 RepID=UPI00145F9273|nr:MULTISPECIES: EamA family transporter [unclassified Acidovorax]NMM75852.1 hypothetical protein [Acidovorax sp. SRB_24]NMM81782.1 hypothetical protein [Acidovorax sp. SRB_14]NMM89897.1 hypothetical protein [Rhodococcus sp. SRB_17]